VREFPLFTDAPDDVNERFPHFFEHRLTQPNEGFALAFAQGRYRQNRGFAARIGEQLLDPKASKFELLDNQRKAFALCRATIAESFLRTTAPHPPKKVVIIKGPPGSGKSVIAARLWASLVTDPELRDGDVVFTTTSMSQNTNWSYLFRESGIPSASGVIRKATTYSPISTQRVGALRREHGSEFLEDADLWRQHVQLLRDMGEPFRDGACDNQNLISIVDEAHALINPEHPSGRGQFGFQATLGPQAYHIMRSSLLSIFLLDPLQGFRQRENTSIEDICEWSKELDAGEPEVIDLEGMQFRCAGSTEYVAWIESVLSGAPVAKIRVFDNPEKWEAELRARAAEGSSVRLLATYARPWKTEDAAKPHALPAKLKDFYEPYEVEGKRRFWSRVWNYVLHGADYSWFVLGPPGSFIADDPLCEVGCPYAVRGFDYDYVGILWLDDLSWSGDTWRVDPEVTVETGFIDLIRAARREGRKHAAGPATAELLERVAQAYRILFTRGLKGVYVWVPDAATREYVIESQGGRPT
jgi:hypothetical protein